MSETLNVRAVIGSLHEKSVTKVAVKFVADGLRDAGCTVDVLDLAKEQLPMVASHEKGLTVHDQLHTVARQCYAWSLPYAVSFMEKEDVANGEIVSDKFRDRLEMMMRDVQVYGDLIAAQRRADLAGTDATFLAQLRQ